MPPEDPNQLPPAVPVDDQSMTPEANRGVPTGQIYSRQGYADDANPSAKEPEVPETPHEEISPAEQKKQNRKTLISTVGLLLMAPLIAWSISSFVLQSYQVSGFSMETTLDNKDRLIIDKLPRTLASLFHHQYVPKRGEIIILNEPGNPSEQLIKRVIGLPGERVTVNAATVTVYNDAAPKGFNPDKTGGYSVQPTSQPFQIDVTLGPDEIFVSGDNRDNSRDSRYFGPVKLDSVVGKLSWRIMPFNKFKHF